MLKYKGTDITCSELFFIKAKAVKDKFTGYILKYKKQKTKIMLTFLYSNLDSQTDIFIDEKGINIFRGSDTDSLHLLRRDKQLDRSNLCTKEFYKRHKIYFNVNKGFPVKFKYRGIKRSDNGLIVISLLKVRKFKIGKLKTIKHNQFLNGGVINNGKARKRKILLF